MMEVGAQIIALNTQVQTSTTIYCMLISDRTAADTYSSQRNCRTGRGLVREQTFKLKLQIVASLNIRSLDNYD